MSQTAMLEFVKPTAEPNVNILLYGPPKTGKTMAAASAPEPILYLNADRPNATRLAHHEALKHNRRLDEVRLDRIAVTTAVPAVVEQGDYRTVVVDTVGEAYSAFLREISGNSMSPKIQNYGDAGAHLERFCRWLVEAPVNAVFICHDLPVEANDGDNTLVEHHPLTTTKKGSPHFAAKLLANVDVIGYTGIVIPEGKEGEAAPPKYVAQLFDGGGRFGGDRFGVLGDSRELNLNEWVELAKSATSNDNE